MAFLKDYHLLLVCFSMLKTNKLGKKHDHAVRYEWRRVRWCAMWSCASLLSNQQLQSSIALLRFITLTLLGDCFLFPIEKLSVRLQSLKKACYWTIPPKSLNIAQLLKIFHLATLVMRETWCFSHVPSTLSTRLWSENFFFVILMLDSKVCRRQKWSLWSQSSLKAL